MTKTRIASLALVAAAFITIAPAFAQAQTYRTSHHGHTTYRPAYTHGGGYHGGGYHGGGYHGGGYHGGGYHGGGYHGGGYHGGGYHGGPNPHQIMNGVGQIVHGANHGGHHGGAQIASGILGIVGGAIGH